VEQINSGEHVKIIKREHRWLFETGARVITFEMHGKTSLGQPVQARYSLCKTGSAPVLFFVEQPGVFELASATVFRERLEWPEPGADPQPASVERLASEDNDYCRWIYRARNETDDSVSAQVDFHHNEDVSSWVSFNLAPRGERRDELDINFIISVDRDARILSQVFMRNPVFRA
jgi:hypothetical protein